MKRLNAEEIKQTLYEMMCCFADYCDRHGLKYYMYYGTLLGAVRHQGFIPWDDDVDFIMPREDYLKLQELYRKDPFPEPYGLISYEMGNTVYPFAKFVNHATEFRGKTTVGDTELWIDLFPLDPVPEDREVNRKLFVKCGRLLMWHAASIAIPFTGSTPLRALIRGPIVLYARMRGYEHYNKLIMNEVEKVKDLNSVMMGNITWPSTYDVPLHKDDLAEYEDLVFEGRKFHAMKNYKKYLAEYYGDYMTPPPESKRTGHVAEIYLK